MRPRGVERAADGADPPVHHVGRRDDVAAGVRLDERLLDQHLDGLVVEDLAVPQQAVMAVAGIGIERDVAQHADIGHFLLDGADGAADEVFRIEGLGAGLVAKSRLGIGKQGEAGDVEPRRPFGVAHGLVDRNPLHPRHRADRDALPLAVDDEQRPDQVVGGEHVLPHHAPRPFGFAVAAVACGEVERRRAPSRRSRLGRGKTDGRLERAAVLYGHEHAPDGELLLTAGRMFYP